MCIGKSRCLLDLGFGGIKATEADIFVDSVVKEEALLSHNSNLLSQGMKRQVAQVMPINAHASLLWIIEAQEQREDRAFTSTTGTNKSDFLTRLNGQIEPTDCIAFLGSKPKLTVGKGDIFQENMTLYLLEGLCIRAIDDGGLGGQEFEDTCGRPDTILNRHMDATQIFHRVVEKKEPQQQSEETADREM